MTRASTRRIRFTQAAYALALAAAALSDGRAWDGTAGLLVQALGFALVAAGTLWRIWTSAFIAGRKDVELVDIGPYGRCRHPLYFGSLLTGVGLGLTTRSALLTLVLAVVPGIAFWRSIRHEEAGLATRHGAAWRSYCERVPAFLPRSGRLTLPASREVDLPVFRKAFVDAAAVLALWLAVLLLDGLHTRQAWPAYFSLP